MRRDLRKPLFLQAAIAKARLVQEDVCKCCKLFTARLVQTRQSERSLLDRYMTGTKGQSIQCATRQACSEWLLHTCMYASHRTLPRGGCRSPGKAVCYSHMPSDLLAYHVCTSKRWNSTYSPNLYFLFLTPGSSGCPLGITFPKWQVY